MTTEFIMLSVLAYLLGSIPTGKIVGNLHGIDIQKKGSGNIGFANAVRVLGWRPAMFVLFGDATKGFIPTYIAVEHLDRPYFFIVAILVILGNVYPVWLRFKGGKAIATGLGVTLAINPVLALCGLCVYATAFILTHKSAIASMLSSLSLPVFCMFMWPDLAGFFALLALFALWTHRTNIQVLMAKK